MNSLAMAATTSGIVVNNVYTWPEAIMWIGVAWAGVFGVWSFIKYM